MNLNDSQDCLLVPSPVEDDGHHSFGSLKGYNLGLDDSFWDGDQPQDATWACSSLKDPFAVEPTVDNPVPTKRREKDPLELSISLLDQDFSKVGTSLDLQFPGGESSRLSPSPFEQQEEKEDTASRSKNKRVESRSLPRNNCRRRDRGCTSQSPGTSSRSPSRSTSRERRQRVKRAQKEIVATASTDSLLEGDTLHSLGKRDSIVELLKPGKELPGAQRKRPILGRSVTDTKVARPAKSESKLKRRQTDAIQRSPKKGTQREARDYSRRLASASRSPKRSKSSARRSPPRPKVNTSDGGKNRASTEATCRSPKKEQPNLQADNKDRGRNSTPRRVNSNSKLMPSRVRSGLRTRGIPSREGTRSAKDSQGATEKRMRIARRARSMDMLKGSLTPEDLPSLTAPTGRDVATAATTLSPNTDSLKAGNEEHKRHGASSKSSKSSVANLIKGKWGMRHKQALATSANTKK